MAIRVPIDETLGVNMTPMIDIVFNLVTFFMLTLDMSRKELAALDLPRAQHGIVDRPDQTAAERRLVLNVLPSGDVQLKGVVYPLTTPSSAEQARSLESLRAAIATLVRLRPRLADGTSDVDVFVRGDRGTPWRKVQWLLQTLADPTIRAPHVTFSVEGDPATKGR